MRTKRIKLYSFEELTSEAQQNAIERARENAYSDTNLDFFAEDAKEQLSTVGFNNAKISYSLSYCQGDGLSFDADIDLEYFLDLFALSLTPYRKLVLLNYISASCIANNGRYSYASKNDIEITLDAYNRDYTNIEKFVSDLDNFITDCYMDECEKLEKQGYDEIEYQQSDEYLKQVIIADEYEFLKDGTQY